MFQNSPEVEQVPPYMVQCGCTDLPALNMVVKQSKTASIASVSLHDPPKIVLPSDQLSQRVPQSKLPDVPEATEHPSTESSSSAAFDNTTSTAWKLPAIMPNVMSVSPGCSQGHLAKVNYVPIRTPKEY